MALPRGESSLITSTTQFLGNEMSLGFERDAGDSSGLPTLVRGYAGPQPCCTVVAVPWQAHQLLLACPTLLSLQQSSV